MAISDATGALRERLAYDSWGKRRNLGGDATPDSLDGVTDNRGFTGHEMLDRLDLVHMNGRVYDPQVARFMSADPIIQDPEHSQSYNRYTYVWNNPTNLTDPTGFLTSDNVVSFPNGIKIQQCGEQSNCWIQDGVPTSTDPGQASPGGTQKGNDSNKKYPDISAKSANSNTTGQGQQSGGDSPGINQVIIPGKRTPDNTSPWGLGVEWLTGTGPRTHTFTDGDPFAEMLRKHRHIQNVIQRAKSGELKPKGRDPYSVGGLIGIPLYFHDYSNLLTGGNTGNLAVTFLGSYGLSYEVNDEILTMTITNNSTISSATHPPVLGYTQWWRQNIEPTLNRQFESGPLSKTSQTIILHENIGGDRK